MVIIIKFFNFRNYDKIIRYTIFLYNTKIMQSKTENKSFDISLVIQTILNCIQQITVLLQHSPVVKLETVKYTGDYQLSLNFECGKIVRRHFKENPQIRGFINQETHQFTEVNKGIGGYVVTYDALNGSTVIDTNFSVGSIFSVWPHDQEGLLGKKVADQVNAVLAIYGPRTTAIFYNQEVNLVQELTMIQGQWMLSHLKCTINEKTNIFSPGNIKAATENGQYLQLFNKWVQKGYTLRYTGGMVPDVSQIFIKGHGIFCYCESKSYQSEHKVLYELACIGFLIEKAGGKTITVNKIPLTEYKIQSYDDKIPFAAGSSNQIQSLSQLF